MSAPEPIVYNSSVKVSQNAKGLAQVDVHVYGNDDNETRKRAIALYVETLLELKAKDIPVAAEVSAARGTVPEKDTRN